MTHTPRPVFGSRLAWPFLVNFFVYAGYAAVVPFFVLYYQELGFSGTQIGLLTGLTPLVTLFFSPFWTSLADRSRRHRPIMSLLMLAGVLVLAAFPALRAFSTVFLGIVMVNIFLASSVPFTDSATMHMLGERKELYGRIRLGGTVGFGIAAVIAGGLVERSGLRVAFWAAALLFLAALLAARKLEFGGSERAERGALKLAELFKDTRWLAFAALAFGGGLGFTAMNVYLYSYMAALGAGESLMGWAVAAGTVAEVPILFFGHRFLRAFKPFSLLALAVAFSGARLLLFAVNHTPELVLAIQMLNGLTFALMWMAGVAYADRYAPAGMKATVQGLFGAMVFGIGSATGGFMGGPLLERLGGQGLYLVFGLVILAVSAAGWAVYLRSRPVP